MQKSYQLYFSFFNCQESRVKGQGSRQTRQFAQSARHIHFEQKEISGEITVS